MHSREKIEAKLRWGLTLKKILDLNKQYNLDYKAEHGEKDKDIIDSFGKLEIESEITKSTLVNLVKGRINGASTTWTAILIALDMSLTEFAKVYDSISVAELQKHKEDSKPLAVKRKRK